MFSAEVALAPENLSIITIAMTDFHEHGHGFDDSHDKIDAVDDDRLDLVAYLFYKNHCDHCNDNSDNNDKITTAKEITIAMKKITTAMAKLTL